MRTAPFIPGPLRPPHASGAGLTLGSGLAPAAAGGSGAGSVHAEHSQPMHRLLTAQQTDRRQARAFTRLELAAALAALALLAMLVLPALASSQSRGHVAQCLNNLRLIGRGVQLWGADYIDQPPWRTPVSIGGLLPSPASSPRPGNAWFGYVIMSNQLVTPRILTCPADGDVKMATDWSIYIGLGYRQNATSYPIGLHSQNEFPLSPISFDRNIRYSPGFTLCSLKVNNTRDISQADPSVGWTNAPASAPAFSQVGHGLQGNLVRMDGAALTTSSEGLRAAVNSPNVDTSENFHVLPAR